jgi:DNA-binding IclR family transcriptional regulator
LHPRQGKEEETFMVRENTEATAARATKSNYNQRVPAVEQASKILLCLAKSLHPQLSLTEICGQVGIHKSKGYSILNTFLECGLVVRNRDARTYSLGPAVLFLSRRVLDSMDLKAVVAPYLEQLAEATQSTALLGLISAESVFIVARHEVSEHIGVTIRVGHRYPLTWGAHGKAIVAFLSKYHRDRILAETELRFHGQAGEHQADTTLIEKELDECRRLGYAKDLGQVQAGINAVSAPVLGSGSTPIGCLIAVGTFPDALGDTYGEQTAATARRISSLIGPTIERIYGVRSEEKK